MDYCPNTEKEQKEMLARIGVKDVEELFSSIPKDLWAKSFEIPSGKSEFEVISYFQKLSAGKEMKPVCFLGAGMYDHYIPSVVDALASRAEFYTSYTPYQPECSQGTLQALFEYQTAICRLTGMEVSNASLYDGATALAEGALMAMRLTGRKKIICDQSVHPNYRAVVKSYLVNHDVELIEIAPARDKTNQPEIISLLDEEAAAVLIQNPNFFGTIEDFSTLSEVVHQKGGLLVQSSYPIALGILKTPLETGADIVTGDGQSLGINLSFGGPTLGFIATMKNNIRQLPGRIVGETVDKNGKRAFVLTLQAREQHIKRQKATSNICSNQSLCALRSLFYLSLTGKTGFVEISRRNRDKAEYAKKEFSKIKGIKIWNSSLTFNEFVLEFPVSAVQTAEKLMASGILPGLPLGQYYPGMENMLLVAVTEKRTKEEILEMKKRLEEAVC